MHVDELGLDHMYDLKLDPELVNAANLPASPANTFLKQSSIGDIRKHFNLTVRPTIFLPHHKFPCSSYLIQSKSGARHMIDQFLVAAVIYAQAVLDQNEVIKAEIAERFDIDNPHVAVFTHVWIPDTKVQRGNTSYSFYGTLDYGFGFISTMLKGNLPVTPLLISLLRWSRCTCQW